MATRWSSRRSATSSSATVSSPQVSTSDDFEEGTTPLSPTRMTRLQEKYELQKLNDRLASYIDRVRSLETENSRLSIQVQTSQETVSREVNNIKSVYERELSDARKFVDDISREKARLQIENDKWKNELNDVNAKLLKKEKDYSSDHKKLIEAESQCNDLQARLNQLTAEKKRLQASFAEMKDDRDQLAKQLDAANAKLEEDAIYRVDLLNKIQSVKEELTFRESIHEQEMSESRISRQMNVSDIDLNVKQNYEQKLADTLREIREQYESEMKFNREEIETLYETKLADMQHMCDQYSGTSANMKNELKNFRSKFDALTTKSEELQASNESLKHRIKDLERLLEQEREWHQCALQGKEDEVRSLREELDHQLQEYQDLLGIKVALDMEIAAYRKLLEGEESRLNITPAKEVVEKRSATPRRTPVRAKRRRTHMQLGESSHDFQSTASAKGDVEVCEHDPEGKFIKLHNKGNTDIPLGKWQLVTKAGDQETIFKFHRTMVIKANSFVTVWSSDSGVTHNPPNDVVMKGQKWFVASIMTTTLLNNNAEEMASRETSKKIHHEQEIFDVSHAANEELYNGSEEVNVRERCTIM